MAKKRIASFDLARIFQNKLAELYGYRIPIEIVPVGLRWTAQTSLAAKAERPGCVTQIRLLEAKLRKRYDLLKDQAPLRTKVVVHKNSRRNPAFRLGDRVRLSALGRNKSPRLMSESGTVIAEIPGNVVRLMIDGRVDPITLHVSYVEKLTPD